MLTNDVDVVVVFFKEDIAQIHANLKLMALLSSL